MACFGINGPPPDPPRTWTRFENRCISDSENFTGEVYVPLLGKTLTSIDAINEYDMLNKGNVLQYKKNSSNLTKNQRYAQIAKRKWVNRNTTWASQSVTSSQPNTKSLKRVNYDTIYLDETPANLPITCPTPEVFIIPRTLPINPNPIPVISRQNETLLPTICPIYVNPNDNNNIPPTPQIPSSLPIKPVDPPPPEDIIQDLPYIKEDIEPEEPDIIPDGGQLLCGVTADICTGEIISVNENNYCNPTTASDVPGPIVDLCYNSNKYPTYYPRQRSSYRGGGNAFWPTKQQLSYNQYRSSPGNNGGDENHLNKLLITLYENVGMDLGILLSYYSNGDMDTLQELLTYDVYQSLATKLITESAPQYTSYHQIHQLLTKTLQGLFSSVQLNSSQKNTIHKLQQELANALNPNTSLMINTLNVMGSLDTRALIKPEIKIYIQRWGYPLGGVFDPTKLADIINELGI